MPKCIVILFHDFIDEIHIEIRTATYVHGDLMEEKIVEEFTAVSYTHLTLPTTERV